MPKLSFESFIDVKNNWAYFIIFYHTDQSENEIGFMKMGEGPAVFRA